MNKIYDDPLLIYNFESFLFQMKSCPDVFSQLLAYSFKLESTTSTKFGDDLVKMFQKRLQKESRTGMKTVIGIIEGSRNWIKELVDMRDEVSGNDLCCKYDESQTNLFMMPPTVDPLIFSSFFCATI
jgi:hypothetical protein